MLALEGLWKTLGLWTEKVVGCCEQGLMICPSRSLGDGRAGNRMDHGGPFPEVSEEQHFRGDEGEGFPTVYMNIYLIKSTHNKIFKYQ